MAQASDRRPIEVKTTLSESHYNLMLDVCEALGLTQAGYVRSLIHRDIVEKQQLVEQMAELAERPKPARRRA